MPECELYRQERGLGRGDSDKRGAQSPSVGTSPPERERPGQRADDGTVHHSGDEPGKESDDAAASEPDKDEPEESRS
jgi:hypothetical protein